MTQEAKLKNIIEKAVENGWVDVEGLSVIEIDGSAFLLKEYAPKHIFFDVGELLFDKSFAQAIWGEGWMLTGEKEPFGDMVAEKGIRTFQYHLQRAVLSNDPISYYYENL